VTIIPAEVTSRSHALSLVIPVYKNEENLPRLFRELETFADRLGCDLEVVFVVDGSPDASLRIPREHLPSWRLRTQLVELSRNFGSFAAIAAGMQQARGNTWRRSRPTCRTAGAALESHRRLSSGEVDVVRHRTGRADPWLSHVLSEGSGGFTAGSSSATCRGAGSMSSRARARSAIISWR
jgi:hypothetical protein